MQKLELKDVLAPHAFASVRDERRSAVIALKKKRRVSVGPQVTLVFENRETMRWQVEEMCRAESITEPAKIQSELDTYNGVLPGDGGLAATLFIEVQSDLALRRTLDSLVGLQNHVWIAVGSERVRATFDEDQFTTDKLAAVQYLKFPLSASARALLLVPGADARVAIDHPEYAHEARLSEATRAELARDVM